MIITIATTTTVTAVVCRSCYYHLSLPPGAVCWFVFNRSFFSEFAVQFRLGPSKVGFEDWCDKIPSLVSPNQLSHCWLGDWKGCWSAKNSCTVCKSFLLTRCP